MKRLWHSWRNFNALASRVNGLKVVIMKVSFNSFFEFKR